MFELPEGHVIFVENLVILVVVLDVTSDHFVVDDSWFDAFFIFFNFALVAKAVLDFLLHLILLNSNITA